MNISSYWSGGVPPLTYSVASGTLPAGLSLNAVTGDVGGTPTEVGVFPVVFRALDGLSNYSDSNIVTFDIDGVGYWVYDSFSSDGAIATRVGEIGADWDVLTTYGNIYGSASPPSVFASAGHLRMAGNVAWGQALVIFRPSGQPAPGDPDAYIEFEADLPYDHASDSTSQVSVNVLNAAGTSTEMRVLLTRSQYWSATKWALLVDAADLLFGNVVDLTNVPAPTTVDFVEGVPIKVRVEYRDGGTDVRLYLNNTLVEYVGDGSAFEFAEVRLSFYAERQEPDIDSDVTEASVRLNYLKVGDLTGIPGPLTFAIPLPDAPATQGAAFSLATATHWFGGTAPVTYSVVSGALPAGLSLNSSTGVISGTPTTGGASTATLRATDDNAVTADSNSFGITVATTTVRWLAVDTSLTVRYSDDDGATWTSTGYAFAGGAVICWGNGLFVAGINTAAANNIYTSPDGITWTQRTVSSVARRTAMAWNGSIFVAANNISGTTKVETSPDGITWTSRTVPVSSAFVATGVYWAHDTFVLTTQDATSKAATSPDGITWTACEPPVLTGGSGYARATLKIGSTYSMLPESSTTRFLTTTGFSSFTQSTYGATAFPITATHGGIASDGTTWVCVGAGGIFSTTDGTTFTLRQSGSFSRVHWTGSKFLARSGSTVVWSSDGVTWSTVSASPSFTGTGQAVAFEQTY